MHERARLRGFSFTHLLISQAWNRTRPVEDYSFVHTLQRKCRCDARREMHILSKSSCKKIPQSVMRCSRKSGPEIGWACVDWINLAREMNQQRLLVSMVIRQQVAVLIYLYPMMWHFLCS